jgi:hypothetical protein
MHTLKVIAGGFILLAVCLLIGRLAGGPSAEGVAGAAKVFIPLWLLLAGVNLWIGVTRAGYTVAEEAPIFLVVFALPAAAALLLVWWLSRA